MVKIACIQINSDNDMEANITKAVKIARKAARAGAEMVSTPECVAFMAHDTEDLFDNLYDIQEHPALISFTEVAIELGIWMLVGSIAVKNANGSLPFNRSLLINDKGKIVAEYDKIHLFDIKNSSGAFMSETERYMPGSKAVIADTPWGGLGMTICYDIRFPHLYRVLALKGAVFMSVPSAFTRFTGKAHWEVLLRARAIETGCFVFAPAQTGWHGDKIQTYGHSMIIDPWGKVLADAGVDEGFIMADIDMNMVEDTRSLLPSLRNNVSFRV